MQRGKHLLYLDGMRGLAALTVVIVHLLEPPEFRTTGSSHVPEQAEGILRHFEIFLGRMAFGLGHFPVDLFIVLSGYCLMRPVTMSSNGQLRGGFFDYMKRRALRILPPYYFALAFSVGMAAITPGLMMPSQGAVLSHALLIHNLSPAWIYTVNTPMWSVAVEWQIYFLFALLLLPIWRQGGNILVLTASFMMGVAPLILLPAARNFDWSHPWYCGLFSLGMVASSLERPRDRPPRIVRQLKLISLVASVGLCAVVIVILGRAGRLHVPRSGTWLLDSIVGVGTCCILLNLREKTHGSDRGRSIRWLRTFFESKQLIAVGAFSYSLYLIHYPLIVFVSALMRHVQIPATIAYFVVIFLGLPVSLLGGYLFYLAVERHCVSSKRSIRTENLSSPPLRVETVAISG